MVALMGAAPMETAPVETAPMGAAPMGAAPMGMGLMETALMGMALMEEVWEERRERRAVVAQPPKTNLSNQSARETHFAGALPCRRHLPFVLPLAMRRVAIVYSPAPAYATSLVT